MSAALSLEDNNAINGKTTTQPMTTSWLVVTSQPLVGGDWDGCEHEGGVVVTVVTNCAKAEACVCCVCVRIVSLSGEGGGGGGREDEQKTWISNQFHTRTQHRSFQYLWTGEFNKSYNEKKSTVHNWSYFALLVDYYKYIHIHMRIHDKIYTVYIHVHVSYWIYSPLLAYNKYLVYMHINNYPSLPTSPHTAALQANTRCVCVRCVYIPQPSAAHSWQRHLCICRRVCIRISVVCI